MLNVFRRWKLLIQGLTSYVKFLFIAGNVFARTWYESSGTRRVVLFAYSWYILKNNYEQIPVCRKCTLFVGIAAWAKLGYLVCIMSFFFKQSAGTAVWNAGLVW